MSAGKLNTSSKPNGNSTDTNAINNNNINNNIGNNKSQVTSKSNFNRNLNTSIRGNLNKVSNVSNEEVVKKKIVKQIKKPNTHKNKSNGNLKATDNESDTSKTNSSSGASDDQSSGNWISDLNSRFNLNTIVKLFHLVYSLINKYFILGSNGNTTEVSGGKGIFRPFAVLALPGVNLFRRFSTYRRLPQGEPAPKDRLEKELDRLTNKIVSDLTKFNWLSSLHFYI